MAAPALAGTDASAFRGRVDALCDEYAQLWLSTPTDLPVLGPRTGHFRQYANARTTARLIDSLSTEVAHLPETPEARRAWQESVRARVQTFGAERLGWPEGYRRLMCGDAFFTAASDFVRDARRFDAQLTLDDLWQALRNMWIGNALQMLLDLPVRSTPSLFAYSMLYPLTDNVLDDGSVSNATKQQFNLRLGHRLMGLAVGPADAREAAVFELVATIEREFPRHRHPTVFASLLAIHRAQVESVAQQLGQAQAHHRPRGDGSLDEQRLLALSCGKGGASLLADLYLVAGNASEDEERFAFGYGVALQLMDDLQDVTSDTVARHQTLVTSACARGPLDGFAARLLQFIDRVLDGAVGLAPFDDRIDLLRRNCRSLVVGAIAEQPSRFTARFRRAVTRQWPLSLGGLRRLRRRAQRRLPAERLHHLLADCVTGRLSAV